MVREARTNPRTPLTRAFAVWLGLAAGACASEPGAPIPSRAFAASRNSIDQILTRPFDHDVPMGCTGKRVWASSPQGWAFRDDVHWIDSTALAAFDLEIRDERGLLAPASGSYYPSHIRLDGAVHKEMSASASFTFSLDNVDNPLHRPFEPSKRWTCWSSGRRQDWYEVDFGMPRTLAGFDLLFFDDAPHGGCRPPESFQIQFLDGKDRIWSRVETTRAFPALPKPGENRVRFEPVVSSRFRVVIAPRWPRFLYRTLRRRADPRESRSDTFFGQSA